MLDNPEIEIALADDGTQKGALEERGAEGELLGNSWLDHDAREAARSSWRMTVTGREGEGGGQTTAGMKFGGAGACHLTSPDATVPKINIEGK